MKTGVWAIDLAEDRASQALVVGWLRLAVASLAVAGLFALLVAVARTPGIQSIVGEEYFRVSLVGHVTFSLNVWLMSFTGTLWSLAVVRTKGPFNGKLGWVSLWLAGAGAATMAGASIAGLGAPSLVDYIPVLEHPAFAVGMATFFAGIGLAAVNFLATIRRLPTPLSLEAKSLRIAAVACLMAVATFIVAWRVGWSGDWAALVWGPGHLLQVVNGAAMISVWLLSLPSGLPQRSRTLIRATLPLFLLPAALVPLLYLFPGPLPRGMVGAVTWIGVAIPTTTALLAIGLMIVKRHPAGAPISLLISLLLFSTGVLAAVLGMEGDTRVTAHYHGTVGAVTLSFMGLAFRLLLALGINMRLPRVATIQPLLYGCGLLLLIAGLFWASSYGGQRKVFEAFAQHSGVIGPMGLFVMGAILALVGGAAFVLAMGASLLSKSGKPLLAGQDLSSGTLSPQIGQSISSRYP